jgi:LmbE family N-acetylglucosaminyl deacetylase
MIFSPHPDDEALMAAGVIKKGLDEGKEVLVANVTNGDRKGKEMGEKRIVESIDAMNLLGLR